MKEASLFMYSSQFGRAAAPRETALGWTHNPRHPFYRRCRQRPAPCPHRHLQLNV